MRVLQLNHSATVVLVMQLLPEFGAVSCWTETMARVRDLSFLQLANERELGISEVANLLNDVGDSSGRLVLISKITSAKNNGVVALEVRYQAYTAQ